MCGGFIGPPRKHQRAGESAVIPSRSTRSQIRFPQTATVFCIPFGVHVQNSKSKYVLNSSSSVIKICYLCHAHGCHIRLKQRVIHVTVEKHFVVYPYIGVQTRRIQKSAGPFKTQTNGQKVKNNNKRCHFFFFFLIRHCGCRRQDNVMRKKKLVSSYQEKKNVRPVATSVPGRRVRRVVPRTRVCITRACVCARAIVTASYRLPRRRLARGKRARRVEDASTTVRRIVVAVTRGARDRTRMLVSRSPQPGARRPAGPQPQEQRTGGDRTPCRLRVRAHAVYGGSNRPRHVLERFLWDRHGRRVPTHGSDPISGRNRSRNARYLGKMKRDCYDYGGNGNTSTRATPEHAYCDNGVFSFHVCVRDRESYATCPRSRATKHQSVRR